MSNERGDVKVVTTVTGPDEYRIVATARFESSPAQAWGLLWDWERFIAVGLPGMTSNFKWLSGGPDTVPSSFQFEVSGVNIKEEIYERAADEAEGRYSLRYRVLEPALGVLRYDAIIELRLADGAHTAFSAVRDVQLESGTTPDALAGMVESETQNLKAHFAV